MDRPVTPEMIEATVKPLKRSDVMRGKVITAGWEPNLEYAWDNGKVLDEYLEGFRQGKILGKRCRKCKRILLPPRIFCELCWRPTDEWVELPDTGTINTFCVSYVDWKAGRLDIEGGVRPFTPAVIEIDGAGKDNGILHHVDEVDPWAIHIGMKVKAVWKPAAEREGSVTDLLYFKPVGRVRPGKPPAVVGAGKKKVAKKSAKKAAKKSAKKTAKKSAKKTAKRGSRKR